MGNHEEITLIDKDIAQIMQKLQRELLTSGSHH